MVDTQQLATSLVSFSILAAGLGLAVGGVLLFMAGNGLAGFFLFAFGAAVLVGGFFFSLVPLKAESYRPGAEAPGDDEGERGNGGGQ